MFYCYCGKGSDCSLKNLIMFFIMCVVFFVFFVVLVVVARVQFAVKVFNHDFYNCLLLLLLLLFCFIVIVAGLQIAAKRV